MDTTVVEKRVTFSNEEDNIIIEKVKQYPTNLQHAFSEAAITLDNGKTRTQVEGRWYSKLRKKAGVHAVSVGSERGFSRNTKNVARKDGTMPEQGLKPHLYVLKQIFNLSPAEREEIIRILNANL